jgi:hypothetical protein
MWRVCLCVVQVKKWQALNSKRYAEKRKYGYTQVRRSSSSRQQQQTAAGRHFHHAM